MQFTTTSHIKVLRQISNSAITGLGQKYLAIQLDHIPKITEFLLKHSYFTVGGMVFRQIQGASMGRHFAPALCGLVAAFQEYCFHKAFNGMRTHHKLLHNSRYVDNRVLMHFPGWRETYPWNLFTKLDFYEAPILLEEVDDTEILGCTISTIQRTITVRQPGLSQSFQHFVLGHYSSFATPFQFL